MSDTRRGYGRKPDGEVFHTHPAHILTAIQFLTRIPVPGVSGATTPSAASWAFPLAGIVIAAVGSAVLLIALAIGLPAAVAATFAVAAGVAVTGALHEDGLADTFDGFGGSGRERRLEIMSDSGIGTFGMAALILSLTMRIAALAVLASRSPGMAVGALIAAEAVSRALMVAAWHATPPAKPDSLSERDGPPARSAAVIGGILGFVALVAALVGGLGLKQIAFASVFAAIAAYVLTLVTMRSLGGRTGDTLGAAQQLALAGFLAGASVI